MKPHISLQNGTWTVSARPGAVVFESYWRAAHLFCRRLHLDELTRLSEEIGYDRF